MIRAFSLQKWSDDVDDLTADETLDALGLKCPLPVLKARKRLKAMAGGAVLRIEADDPAAVIDVPHFCAEQGHDLISDYRDGDTLVFMVRNKA